MANGFSNNAEAALLDDASSGLGRTLYLYLFKYDGYLAGNGAKVFMDDDGTITGRTITATIALTNASTTITDSGASFTAADVGKVIDESTGKIPALTTIASVTNTTTAVLSAAATATVAAGTAKINQFSLATALSPSYKTVASGDWGAAVGGAPTTKGTTSTLAFVASAANEICWMALNTVIGTTIVDQSTWNSNKSTMIFHGPITDPSTGVQKVITLANGETFQFDSADPIKAQLGDTSDTFS